MHVNGAIYLHEDRDDILERVRGRASDKVSESREAHEDAGKLGGAHTRVRVVADKRTQIELRSLNNVKLVEFTASQDPKTNLVYEKVEAHGPLWRLPSELLALDEESGTDEEVDHLTKVLVAQLGEAQHEVVHQSIHRAKFDGTLK